MSDVQSNPPHPKPDWLDHPGTLFALGLESSPRPFQGWEPPTVEELQSVLPQFQISTFLARGGMGAVYRATQKFLDRPIAIKILPPDIDPGGYDYATRFKREAQAMAKLSHPNIVTVFESEETASGLLYFVMEFVDGFDLAQFIASNGKIEPERALEITERVCDALAFAHAEGIIHRDIKPANIMLDKHGVVKVADFGLAKVIAHESVAFTRSLYAVGTADYIAPEAMTPGIQLDARADIYAVGVMLYQMLTGKVPRGRFEPPSALVPKLNRRFDHIVDKAMQTDREKRFASAVKMKEALRAGKTGLSPLRAAATMALIVVIVLMVSGFLHYKTLGTAASTPPAGEPHWALGDPSEKWTDGLAAFWHGDWKTTQSLLSFRKTSTGGAYARRRWDFLPMNPHDQPMRDQALRLVWRMTSDEGLRARVRAGTDFSGLHVGYEVEVCPKDSVIRLNWLAGDAPSRVLASAPLPAGQDWSLPHTLEVRTVGKLISAALDGVAVLRVNDDKTRNGLIRIGLSEDSILERLEYAGLNGSELRPTPPDNLSVDPVAGSDFTTGLISWWKADGDARDSYGGNHGGLVGEVDFAEGLFGKAFRLQGGYVEVPDSPSLRFGPDSRFTVTLWAYRTDANLPFHLFGKRVMIPPEVDRMGGYQLGLDNNMPDTPVNQWVAWTYVYDGQREVVYIDGRFAWDFDRGPLDPVNDAAFRIGASAEYRGFRGLIDDVRIYGRAFSAADVRSLYEVQRVAATERLRAPVTRPTSDVPVHNN